MPPRLNILPSFRALSIRSRPLAPPCVAAQTRRLTSDTVDSSQLEANFSDVLRAKMHAFGQAKEAPEAPVLSENEIALNQLQQAAYGLNTFDPEVHGHKFGVPALPIAPDMNHKRRYDTVVEQVTKLLMRHGKLAKAQRVSPLVFSAEM
jgi:small subunit ribosomal protein S7